MSKCGARPRYGIDLVRRKRQDDALDLGVGQPFERGEEEPRRPTVVRSTSASVGTTSRVRPRAAAAAANNALAGGVRPVTRAAGAPSAEPAGGRLQERAKRERTGGVGGHDARFRRAPEPIDYNARPAPASAAVGTILAALARRCVSTAGESSLRGPRRSRESAVPACSKGCHMPNKVLTLRRYHAGLRHGHRRQEPKTKCSRRRRNTPARNTT